MPYLNCNDALTNDPLTILLQTNSSTTITYAYISPFTYKQLGYKYVALIGVTNGTCIRSIGSGSDYESWPYSTGEYVEINDLKNSNGNNYCIGIRKTSGTIASVAFRFK